MQNTHMKTDLSEYFSGEALEAAKKRLDAGEPIEYITGKAYFYREEYDVSPAVLIPRPDTERVVERLVALLPEGGHFADLCSGSGCIGISALCERRDCTACAYDISEAAVEIAAKNAEKLGVSERYTVKAADITDMSDDAFDIIVSNPPYIESGVIPTLDRSVRDYEPHIALDGGADGLDFYRAILDGYRPRVCYIFEIGYDQAHAICALAYERGLSCEVTKDYGGNDRVAVIKEI